MRITPVLLVLAIAAPWFPTAAQHTARTDVVARLDSLADDFVRNAPAAGATFAVVHHGDTLLLRGAGEKDREHHLSADRQTVYRLGSLTKQFTSAAIMRLVESGRLHLTDTLGVLLPEYPQWSHVTLRQLLNHTSGIHSYTSNEAWAATWNNDLTPAQIVEFVVKDTFDFAPGTRYRYNNTGYVLLGAVLERVTGRPYAEHLTQTFFSPLGMRSAVYCPSRMTDPAHAAGYSLSKGELSPAVYLSMSHPFSAGALCMSVTDFLRWQSALRDGRIVNPATYALMSASDTTSNGARTGYGFGLASGRLGAHAIVRHGGAVNGFNTSELWFPDDSLQVVVFANTAGSNPDLVASNMASAVLGVPLQPRPVPLVALPLPAADRAKYEGTYDLALPNGAVLPLKIWVDGDALVSQAEGPGQGKIVLRYLGKDTFGADFDPSLRITIMFENGKPARARLTQGGGSIEGSRRP